MRKITLFFTLCLLTIGAFAQVPQTFEANGVDDDPTVLTILPGDINVNGANPITALSLGNFSAHYASPTGNSTYCGNWYAFDLAIVGGAADGTTVTAGCSADFEIADILGFTSITITSSSLDTWSDSIYMFIDVNVTFTVSNPPNCDATLTSPTNGNANAATDGNITWSAASGGPDGYYLTVGTTSGGDEVLAFTDVGNVTTYSLGALAESTDYFVNIQAYNSSGSATGCTENTFTTFTTPINIDCANATPITCWQTTLSTTSIGSTGNDEGIGCTLGSNGLWFTFTGTGTETTVNVTASFDQKVAISSGSCGTFTNIACVDDYSAGAAETYTFTTILNETYYVYVAHWSGSSTTTGTIDISINCIVPPACLKPTNLNATTLPGDITAALSWDDEPGATLGYVWQVMGIYDDPDIESPISSGTTAAGVTTDTATGLVSGGIYDFYVRSNCDTDGLSSWAGPFVFTAIAPPVNMDCANALPISCGQAIDTTSVGSTGNQEGSGCSIGDNGIWFTFTGTGGEMTVAVDASFNQEIAITSGTCGALTNIICRDIFAAGATETHTFTTVLDETYYVYVASYLNGDTTTGTVSIDLSCAVPVNDECAGALDYESTFGPIGATGTCNANVDVLSMAPYTSAGASPSCYSNLRRSAMYTWTATTTSITFNPLVGDIGIEIFDGSCGSLTSLGCIDNNLGTISGLTIGDLYYILIYQHLSSETTIEWCLEASAPPPTNTSCATATTISCGQTINTTSIGSTGTREDLMCTMGDNGIWFTFTGTGGGLTLSATSSFTHEISLATGTCGNFGTVPFCNIDSFTFNSDLNETYYVYVAHDIATSTTTGPINITLTCSPPVNDDCAATIGLTVGTAKPYDNTYATDSGVVDPACFTGGNVKDLWYSFTTPSTGVSELVISGPATNYALYSDCSTPVTSGCSSDNPVLLPNTSYLVSITDDGSARTPGTGTIAVTNTLSTQDFDNGLAFTYYPNPVNNSLNLKAQKDIENVSVYNMLGQEVLRTTPNAAATEVNMSELQSGAYFVKVTIGNATETVRIIKK